MTQDRDTAAGEVMYLTGAHKIFFGMLDELIVSVRRAMGVPADRVSDPSIDEEFSRLRQRMAAFLPKFEDIYKRLLAKHLDLEHLAQCVPLLQTEPVRRYVEAVDSMQDELRAELALLGNRIGTLALGE